MKVKLKTRKNKVILQQGMRFIIPEDTNGNKDVVWIIVRIQNSAIKIAYHKNEDKYVLGLLSKAYKAVNDGKWKIIQDDQSKT